jgi:hypothetical protein
LALSSEKKDHHKRRVVRVEKHWSLSIPRQNWALIYIGSASPRSSEELNIGVEAGWAELRAKGLRFARAGSKWLGAGSGSSMGVKLTFLRLSPDSWDLEGDGLTLTRLFLSSWM